MSICYKTKRNKGKWKRLKEESSSESAESSGSESDFGPIKKRRKCIEESSSSENESSGDEGELCAICLNKIKRVPVGSPEGCDHLFCLRCIIEWSKSCNTCPIDRGVFYLIFARESIEDTKVRQIKVEEKKKAEEAEIVDVTVCELCRLGDREDRLLLCDGCNKGFHIDCLNPPLQRVPRGDWFCDTCGNVAGPSRNQTTRMIARTLVYQRVLRNLLGNLEDEESGDSEETDDDDDDDDDSDVEEYDDGFLMSDYNLLGYGFSPVDDDVNPYYEEEQARPPKRTPVKKTKRKSKRKSSRKKKSSKTSSSKSVKSKTKKKKKSSKRKKKHSKKRSERHSRVSQSGSQRKSASFFSPHREVPTFSAFGDQFRVFDFDSAATTDPAPSALQRTSADSSNASVQSSVSQSFDILGDILKSQTVLHLKSSDVKISREGKLVPVKPLPDLRLQGSSEAKVSSSTFFLRDAVPSTSSSISSPSSSPHLSPSQDFLTKVDPSPSLISYSDSSNSSGGNYSLCTDWKDFQSKGLTNCGTNLSACEMNESINPTGNYSPVCLEDDADDYYENNHNIDNFEFDNNCDLGKEKIAMDLVNITHCKPSSEYGVCNATELKSEDGRKHISPDGCVSKNDTLHAFQVLPFDTGSVNSSQIEAISHVGSTNIYNSSTSENIKTNIKEEKIGDIYGNASEDDDYDDTKMDIDYDDGADGKFSSDSSKGCLNLPEDKTQKLQVVEGLVKDALKVYYLSKKITKDDYKSVMRKAVPKIMKSGDKRLDPANIAKFVKQYVTVILSKKRL